MNKTTLTKILGFSVIALMLLLSLAGAVRAMNSSDLFAKAGGLSGSTAPTQDPSLTPSPEATKTHSHLSGTVTAIDATSITVDGTTVAISDKTHIGAGIAAGDTVQLEAVLQADGSLLALEIHKVGPKPSGTPEVKPTKTAEADDDQDQPGVTKTAEADDDQDQPGVTETAEAHKDHSQPGVTRTPEPKETDEHDVKPSVSPEPKETEQEHIKPSVSPEPKQTEQPHVRHTAVPMVTDAAKPSVHQDAAGSQGGNKSAARHNHK